MDKTPKSMRLQIGLLGRTNVGKSTFLNMMANQDVAVTSPIPGTTTDIVEKAMEMLPVGPVMWLDSGGIDDDSALGEVRLRRTRKMFDRADLFILIIEPNSWTEFEDEIIKDIELTGKNFIIVINKTDLNEPTTEFLSKLREKAKYVVKCSGTDKENLEKYRNDVKNAIISSLPDEYLLPLPLLRDLIPKGGLVVLIVPIDSEAPKGRIILPQVQAIRDILDNDSISVVVKETEYLQALASLSRKPDLVVCDSQVVHKMVAETPPDVKCTTFSIMFSRFKGDLAEEVSGVAEIDKLKPGDKILIAEACTHHPLKDDIARIKIPRWLKQYLGFDLNIEYAIGRDYPENLTDYKVIIHCGSCMLTRNEKLVRIRKAKEAGVPITNYGITISKLQGVLERVLSPFRLV